jgi:hypothetical protein
MISISGAYDPSLQADEKDRILSDFLKSTSATLGRLGCNVLKSYSSNASSTITNTSYADHPNMNAGINSSGGAVFVVAKISGGMGTGVSCYGQLTVDGAVVDESRVGSAGGLTNGTVFLFHLIEARGNHSIKVQTKVDSGTFTIVGQSFYVFEILRG